MKDDFNITYNWTNYYLNCSPQFQPYFSWVINNREYRCDIRYFQKNFPLGRYIIVPKEDGSLLLMNQQEDDARALREIKNKKRR